MSEVTFNKDIAIVVQGPLTYYNNIIDTYKNCKSNVIISTNDTNKKAIDTIKANGFEVIVNPIAPIAGRANFNNQVVNTYSGIVKAKTLCFKYILKIRSDIFIDKFIDLLNKFKLDTVYFPAYHNYDGGYLCEHMMFGEIDFMLKLWNVPLSTSKLAPERQLTARFDSINTGYKIDFIFPLLYHYKIMAYWPKHEKYLNEYEKDHLFLYERK